jgi:DNA-binding NarL/FixJ family response regulator
MRREGNKVTVLLVDDHPLVREGVRSALQHLNRFEILGEASTGAEALHLAKEHQPDIVVMDVTMPGMNGLEVPKQLQTLCPQTRVIILTAKDTPEFVQEVIQSGARGYVHKNTSPAELVAAIDRVHAGDLFFQPDVAQSFLEDYVLSGGRVDLASGGRLSKREHEVLGLIVDGLANREIANRFRISVRTVEKHRQSIMKKMRVHKATELVKFAITRGVVVCH